ncbi:MAG: DUF2254 domain-containing protein [Bryobacteraceae bacterium]
MRATWGRWLNLLRNGFWFAPMLMLVLACALALVLLYVDERFDPGIKSKIAWAYSGGPAGARSLLSTIAGSMITAASVTFSLASVALSIASQQYGSRVLRNFMRDRITQVLLGTFVSTFIYSVLVVRAIRGSDVSGGFVPSISVTVAIGLSLASLILLIYFIHHVSTSIQASHIVRVIAEDMEEAIPKLYPSRTGEPIEDLNEPGFRRGKEPLTVTIPKSGYLQMVDLDVLLAVATEEDLVIELIVKPGDHLVKSYGVARIWGTRKLNEQVLTRIVATFQVAGERTPTQDIRFQFQQLTDVVVRALSPGINDPFTAINGIDELASAMLLLAERTRVVRNRKDDNGVLRLTLLTPGLGEILNATVGHIAIYGAADRFVMAGLRRVLDIVERYAHTGSEVETVGQLRKDLDRREQENSSRD